MTIGLSTRRATFCAGSTICGYSSTTRNNAMPIAYATARYNAAKPPSFCTFFTLHLLVVFVVTAYAKSGLPRRRLTFVYLHSLTIIDTRDFTMRSNTYE